VVANAAAHRVEDRAGRHWLRAGHTPIMDRRIEPEFPTLHVKQDDTGCVARQRVEEEWRRAHSYLWCPNGAQVSYSARQLGHLGAVVACPRAEEIGGGMGHRITGPTIAGTRVTCMGAKWGQNALFCMQNTNNFILLGCSARPREM
jgi:hypothetical protein